MKNFDLISALNRQSVVTRNGNKVVVITTSRDKVIANVYKANGFSNIPTQMKFNLDGTYYGPTVESGYDLFMN